MPKYLVQATLTPAGVQGIQKEGGTSRRETIEALFAAHGGSVEAFYFAFGATDVFVIGELPDNETAAAVALAVAASGIVGVQTTVLLTPEEIDAATQIAVDYRPPGG